MQNCHKCPALGLLLAALIAGLWVRAEGRAQEAPAPRELAAAMQAYGQGNEDQAIELYRHYLERHPDDQAVACNLAAIWLEKDQGREAVAVLHRAGVRGEVLGEACLAAGEAERAVAELTWSLGRPGSQWRVRMLLGLTRALQGRYAESVEYYWQALHEDKRQAAVRQLLGWSFQSLGRSVAPEQGYFQQRAQEEFAAALKIDASLWSVHYDLALLAESRERWREALRAWDALANLPGIGPQVQTARARMQQKIAAVADGTPVAAARIPGRAENGLRLKALSVAPLSGSGDPTIRVGLADQIDHLAFGCSHPWTAVDERGRRFWQGRGDRIYRIERLRSGRWALKSQDGKELKPLPKKIVLAPAQPERVLALLQFYQTSGYFWGGGDRATRYYRGRIEITPGKKRLLVVNLVGLEDYLASVVPAEMPAAWPLEAVKAQAIVARTDALNRRGTHGSQNYDVCNNPHCAQYEGVSSEDPRSTQALVSSRGLILYQNEKPALTYYSHACGGVTQDSASAWEKDGGRINPSGVYDLPGNSPACRSLPQAPRPLHAWLAGEPEVWCAHPRYTGKASFRWVKVLTPEQMRLLWGPGSALGSLRHLRVQARSRSGYVRELELVGTQGRSLLQGDRVRIGLGGLRSNLFTVLPIRLAPAQPPAAWVIQGGGWGHGVGFCQAGAGAMGETGYSCQEILEHYFPGCRTGE